MQIIPITAFAHQVKNKETRASTSDSPSFTTLPPLSLYIHFPWCVRKCPYCDFNSHEAKGAIPEADYLAAICADIEQSLPLIWGRRIQTIFIGGGTPSLLSANGVDRLLADVRALLPLNADAEITLEANPGAVDAEKFRAFRASGVNRLSLGVQSFDDEHLKALGRIHSSAQARAAIDIAQQSFNNLNIDLMFALPGQSVAQSLTDVEQALSYAPNHVSCYQLTLEANTFFAKYPPPLPDDDTAFAMQEAIEMRLAQAGFLHYEVSAYARQEQFCKHNLNYWCFGDYLGIGAGAHGKISFSDRIIRQVKHRHPRSYIDAARAGNAVQTEHALLTKDIPFEFMLNAMRLHRGVPLASFAHNTGLPLTALLPKLEVAQQKGLIERDLSILKPTPLGQRFLNDLQAIFLPD